jgi:hypothetical protein
MEWQLTNDIPGMTRSSLEAQEPDINMTFSGVKGVIFQSKTFRWIGAGIRSMGVGDQYAITRGTCGETSEPAEVI